MWSRKKRKKEAAAAAAAGGGAKEGAGGSNGSATATTTSTTANVKLTLPDLSRSRSQSGSPVKEPHQQRSGSVGPNRSGGDNSSLSQLSNGSLQPASKPQGGGGAPPQASLPSQQHQPQNTQPQNTQPQNTQPHGMVIIPPSGSNLKQFPVNQNHPQPVIPPTAAGGGGTEVVLPPQLHAHAPVIDPSLHPPRGPGEPSIVQNQQVGIAAAAVAGGVGIEGNQVKQAHKTLANPNIKPSLTVPLPTVPLSASILESLHEASSKVDTSGTGSSNNSTNNSTTGGVAIGPATTISTSTAQGQLKDPTNVIGAQISADGVGGGGVGVMVSSSATSQQIQQVIDAQRTQLALLSQKITQLVTEQKLRTNPQPDSGDPCTSGDMMRGHISSMAPGLGGYPPKTSSIASRTQTFDYGNRSNKVLESAAVHQLEQEYYHGDQSGRNY